MGIGDVFARAWDLWRRDVGWLILAGLVVGVILVVVLAIAGGIFAALLAGAGAAAGVDALDDSTGGLSGLAAGIGVAGLIVYLIASFFIQVLTMTFYGGLFEMVIGAYREQRGVRFGDLFSGFRKFGSYAVFALVMFGISIGLSVLNILPLIGAIISLVVSIWIWIVWLYVLPLIADQGLSFAEAAGRSNQMVKSAGWWWTFGMVVLLGLAAVVLVALIVLVAMGLYRASDTLGLVVGILLFLVFAVLFPPYSICYVSVLYVASGGDVASVPSGGGMAAGPPPPPSAPGYGATAMTPPGAAYGATAVTRSAGPPAPPASADAWKAAADPLASAPSEVPAAGSAAPPADGAATAVTEAPPAGGPTAPDSPPEPPTPPAPPGGGV